MRSIQRRMLGELMRRGETNSREKIAASDGIATTSCARGGLRAGEEVGAEEFAQVRRRMVLDCCKWDPQIGDVSTLTRFPLLLARGEWDRLARWAEELGRETLDAEE